MTKKLVVFTLSVVFFIIWLLSMNIFVWCLITDIVTGDVITNFIGKIIILGILSFVLFLVTTIISTTSPTKKDKEQSKAIKIKKLLLYTSIPGLLIVVNFIISSDIKEKINTSINYRTPGCSYYIVGRSMEATFIGDPIEAFDCCKNNGCLPIERGDIVVLYANFKKIEHVKRIVGLPKETVTITKGKIFINGKELVEPYVNLDNDTNINGYSCVEYNIPENYYFVLGDNRGNSYDSREDGFMGLGQIKAIQKYADHARKDMSYGLSNEELRNNLPCANYQEIKYIFDARPKPTHGTN